MRRTIVNPNYSFSVGSHNLYLPGLPGSVAALTNGLAATSLQVKGMSPSPRGKKQDKGQNQGNNGSKEESRYR